MNSWEGSAVVNNAESNGTVIYFDISRIALIIHRTDALSKTVKNEGQKPRWSPQDGFILVHKLVLNLELLRNFIDRYL